MCGTLATGGGRRHSTSLETLRQMIAAGAGYSLFPHLATLGEASVGGWSATPASAGRRPAGPSPGLAPERPAGGAVRSLRRGSAGPPAAGHPADGERPDRRGHEKRGARHEAGPRSIRRSRRQPVRITPRDDGPLTSTSIGTPGRSLPVRIARADLTWLTFGAEVSCVFRKRW